MTTNRIRAYLLFAICNLLLGSSVFGEPLRVVTTLEDLASITREVGKERVDVTALVRGNQDPHRLGAKPSLMKALSKADMLISMGLELEVGWLPLVVRGSRNPRIQPGTPGFVEAGEEVEVLEKPTGHVDRSEGDVHPEGNPHWHLDPLAVATAAEAIAEALSTLDPAGKEAYHKNLDDFQGRLDKALEGWLVRMAPFEGMKVIPYHRDMPYLLNRFGLQALSYVEPRPGIAPGPKHLKALSELIEKEKPILLVQPYQDVDLVWKLSASTGGVAVILPGEVGGVEGTRDIFEKFEIIVSRLEEALKGGAR